MTEVVDGQHQTELQDYARSRLRTLLGSSPVRQADVVVTMMWNTDRSDVDLHIIDPNSEECFYENRQTSMGGQLTSDITDGFGPEMFWLPNAKSGAYQVLVKYYAADNLRTGMRSKVYVTVYRNFGRSDQSVQRRTVTLDKRSEKRTVYQFRIK